MLNPDHQPLRRNIREPASLALAGVIRERSQNPFAYFAWFAVRKFESRHLDSYQALAAALNLS
jgi:hypothetical protein